VPTALDRWCGRLTGADDESVAEPGLEVLVLEALVDVLAAAEQRLDVFDPGEEDEGPAADPDEVDVAELPAPAQQFAEEGCGGRKQRV
jgi:hypothetical protein